MKGSKLLCLLFKKKVSTQRTGSGTRKFHFQE